MPFEMFAGTAAQEGRAVNQDAFGIRVGPPAVITLADGAGAADRCARAVVRQFDTLLSAAAPDDVRSFPAWSGWLKALDHGIDGGVQSTFVALALLDDRVVGCAAGDSRAYLWTRDGDLRLLTDGAAKFRLGSGRVEPFPIHAAWTRGDIVLLMSDGAWTPLSLDRLRDTVAQGALRPLAEMPDAVLAQAGRTGVADDMTVVVGRRR
jgi:serine/threonine protein phosphatase PrpC